MARTVIRTQTAAITRTEYQGFQEAYDFFNRALFSSLPQVLVTLQRHARTYGYFSPERFNGRIDKLDFGHLPHFESKSIGRATHVLFVLKGWPCSPCRSRLVENLGRLYTIEVAQVESILDPRMSL